MPLQRLDLTKFMFFLFSLFLAVGAAAASDLISKAEVEARCESLHAADCPAGVALVLAQMDPTDKKLTRCSSFLVDSQTLVTNRHCLPEDLQAVGRSCRGRLRVVFPKSAQYPAESADCEKVLRVSKSFPSTPGSSIDPGLSASYPDFAVLRLNRKLQRPAFKVLREGVPDRSRLLVFAFDPQPESQVKAVLRKKICETLQNTDLLPTYRDDLSPVVAAIGCRIVKGNSGSVVVDEQGQVRAVMHATFELNEAQGALSVMTNAACLDLPTPFGGPDARCEKQRPQGFDFKAFFAAAPAWDFEGEFQNFLEQNRSGVFRYKKTRLFAVDRHVTLPQIECVENSALKTLAAEADGRVRMSMSLPIWGPDKRLLPGYRYEVIPAMMASAYTTIEFDLHPLQTQGSTIAREIRGSFFTYMDNEYPLRICGE